jgi:mRNA-degrading endonuclease RelE of RelBE toxin-antitoxin system
MMASIASFSKKASKYMKGLGSETKKITTKKIDELEVNPSPKTSLTLRITTMDTYSP